MTGSTHPPCARSQQSALHASKTGQRQRFECYASTNQVQSRCAATRNDAMMRSRSLTRSTTTARAATAVNTSRPRRLHGEVLFEAGSPRRAHYRRAHLPTATGYWRDRYWRNRGGASSSRRPAPRLPRGAEPLQLAVAGECTSSTGAPPTVALPSDPRQRRPLSHAWLSVL